MFIFSSKTSFYTVLNNLLYFEQEFILNVFESKNQLNHFRIERLKHIFLNYNNKEEIFKLNKKNCKVIT